MTIMLVKVDEYKIRASWKEFNTDYVKCMKSLKGSRWKPELKVWEFPYTLHLLEQLIELAGYEQLRADSVLMEECYLFHPDDLDSRNQRTANRG
ncbi:hypothetical protein B1748_17455 [Paenibacillus sp. MY03]|uniref:hypothetical protein n=1 Tax=Paenibacillus sp. MY03 TaxID=302980 RepID=UPI000B3C6216|nr:hypothetical protein [Paenibacillus sp. MY03]OUS75279.1 hypothetical protein B1748_17455 [Paenibacillus sp. MY03]